MVNREALAVTAVNLIVAVLFLVADVLSVIHKAPLLVTGMCGVGMGYFGSQPFVWPWWPWRRR